MAESFEEIQHRLLTASVDRLKVFIATFPPKGGTIGGTGFATIIANEIAMTVLRAGGVYGDAVYAALGHYATRAERERLGFCVTCEGSPNPVSDEKTPHGGSYGMCDDCLRSARADEELAAAAEEPNG